MLTPDAKGTIAEAAVAYEAIKLGIGVLKPLNDGLRYDLVFDDRERLLRVQCKWAVRRGDVVVINARTSRRSGDGFVRTSYTAGEIDAIAAYCAEVEACYLVPVELIDGRPTFHLRLAPTRNNQRLGVHWSTDFQFAARLGGRSGAIAQLGERVHGMHEVAGSSPAGSIFGRPPHGGLRAPPD